MARLRRQPRHEARQARNDVYRQHILDAAEAVFAERGFEAAKLQDISKRVGLSMGTIYSIFPSKTDLLSAILEEHGQAILGVVRGVEAQALAGREALSQLSEAYIDYFVAHPMFLRMHLRQGTSWILTPQSGSDTRTRVWQEVHELQAEIFRRGIADGSFVDEDPGYLAKMFSAMDQVLLSDWVAQGMKSPRTDLVRRLGQMVERTFVAAT